jgi:hypothetical protein
MLLCWKVLLPMKNLASFESAVTTLEQMSQRSMLIEPVQSVRASGSASNGDGNQRQLTSPHFYPH